MPRKKTILLSTALAGLVVLGLGGVMVWLSEAGASPEQPIAFSHRQHVENDIHCAFCHPYYEKYDAAGIPRVELCVTMYVLFSKFFPIISIWEIKEGEEEEEAILQATAPVSASEVSI